MFGRRILGKKSNSGYEDVHHSCIVRFLDDTEPLTVTFQKDTTGQYLIDHVCSTLDLVERDFFGLRYVDAEKQRHWLDPTRSAYRQLKTVQPMVLCFRVKFYPSEPLKLKEEITRYYLYLQLTRDFHHGRLLCSQSEANQMAAYMIQAEIGDHGEADLGSDYVSQMKNLPKQIQKQEDKVAEVHKALSGMTPAEAEEKFVEMASHLDTYGVDPHPVKDQAGNSTYLGITHLGVVTFQGNKRTYLFRWPQITKLDFEGKHFIVQATQTADKENAEQQGTVKKKKQSHDFKCPSSAACKHLWKCAVQQQYFFTLQSSSAAPKVKAGGGLFRRPSKYRFMGHCETEVLAESAGITRPQPTFKRAASNPQILQMFDRLGSGSLPSSFRLTSTAKENSCDVVLETRRSESLDQGMAAILERAEETVIREESASASVFETNYEPMLSPEKEELPEFPEAEEQKNEGMEESMECDDSGIDLGNSFDVSMSSTLSPLSEVDFSELASADLDAQIKELQMELEKCKKSSAVSGAAGTLLEDGFSASDVKKSETLTSIPNSFTPNGSNHVGKETFIQNSRTFHDSDVSQEPSVSKCSSATSAADDDSAAVPFSFSRRDVSLLIVVVIVLCLFLMLLALESELAIPVVSNVRRWPEFGHFRSRFYNPLKTALVRFFPW